MKEIYVVTSGEYSDYGIVKIFENIEDAEQFCAIHNDNMKPYDDGYCLEIYPLSDYSEEEKIQTYKALSCRVIEYNDTIPSTVKIIDIETQFSKKPFNKSIKCVDSWYGTCEYSGVIPVNKTYDIYEQREIVEKIIRDEFYKWKAEKEGMEDEYKYYNVTTGHRDWGHDSCDSIEHYEICPKCINKFVADYLGNKDAGLSAYIEIETEHVCYDKIMYV